MEAVSFWIAQLLGAIAAGGLLKLMTSSFGKVTDQTGALGTNDWGASISAAGAFVFEVVGTFLLVLVVLMVTEQSAAPGFAGLAIGLVLTVIHLVGIPLDGTSVNPARSLGPAVFAGTHAMSHLWLFLVAPMIGGATGCSCHPAPLPDHRDRAGGRRTARRSHRRGRSHPLSPAGALAPVASEPAKICGASNDFATRISTR